MRKYGKHVTSFEKWGETIIDTNFRVRLIELIDIYHLIDRVVL